MSSFIPPVRRARRKVRDIRDAAGTVHEPLENRLLFAVILWSENFEGLPLGPSVEEPNAGEEVWTKTPPTGWFKEDSGVPGYNNPDLPTPEPDNNGRTEWIGWTFADKDWWSTAVDTQRRAEVTKGTGTVMIADPDEWDDEDHPGDPPGGPSWASEDQLYNAYITTASIPLAGAVPVVPGSLAFELDSTWRPEGFDDGPGINNQTATIQAIYNTGQTEDLLHWDSDGPPAHDVAGPFYHDDNSTNEHVVLQLHPPAGATSVKFKFGMLHSANDWFWAVDNLALTGTPDVRDVRLLGVSGNGGPVPADDETLWEITYSNSGTPAASATRLLKLPAVPDGDAIAFNPVSGLLFHASGGSSTSETPADPNYRDNHFLETVNAVGGSNALTTVYNANSEQFGRPGPRPTFVLPATRRTDTQTDPAITAEKGPGEYSLARDFVWSSADNAFLVTTLEGIYKVTPTGQSTFVGDPLLGAGGPAGIAFVNIGSNRKLYVTQNEGQYMYAVDPATGVAGDDFVSLADAEGNAIPGITSLAESPDGNSLLGIARDASDAAKRNLVLIDPTTGTVTNLGALPAQINDLAFVYATAGPAAPRVTQVFVNGQNLTNNAAFRGAAGMDQTFGYPVPDGTNQLRPLPWLNGINAVSLRFDTNVAGALDQGDLSVRGSGGPIAVTAFNYDPATKTGTWTLGAPVTLDKVRVVLSAAGVNGLDGEWTNPPSIGAAGDTYPSGDGSAGGDFNFRFNVLRGDATGDGQVNALDLADVKRRLGRRAGDGVTGAGAYSVFGDITMDGQINALDLAAVKQRLNNRLPTPEPATAIL